MSCLLSTLCLPCSTTVKLWDSSFYIYSVWIIPSQDVWSYKKWKLLDFFSLLHLCLTVCSGVLFSALQRDRSVWQPFVLIMFSKHIFHLLLIVPCPHLSYSPPPCSFGPRFNSLRLHHQLLYYLNLKLGERNEIIEVLSAINPVRHYLEQTDALEISMTDMSH